MKKIFVIIAIVILTACGLKTGFVERLAITAVAQEMGVEFARLNPELAKKAVVYLDAFEEFEADQIYYVGMIEVGIDYVFKQLDEARAARLKPFMDQILPEIKIDPNALNLAKIELPDDFDYAAFLSAVRGFRSGLTI